MKRYLLDTNILIYYLADAIPLDRIDEIEAMLRSSFHISIITKIEFLGWKKHTPEGYAKAEEFIRSADVFPLIDTIADSAIHLRRTYGVNYPALKGVVSCFIPPLLRRVHRLDGASRTCYSDKILFLQSELLDIDRSVDIAVVMSAAIGTDPLPV